MPVDAAVHQLARVATLLALPASDPPRGPVPSRPLPDVDFGLFGRVIEAILRGVADRLGPELDLLLAAEVEHRLPGILEAVSPSARHAVVGLAPAELIHESPAPLPPVRDDQILHVQVALAVVGVLFDVQEVGAVRRQNRRDIRGDIPEPVGVLLRRHRLEAARGIILALRGVWRRRDHHVRPRAVEQPRDHAEIAAIAADQPVRLRSARCRRAA